MKISIIDDDRIFQFLTQRQISKISGDHKILPFDNGQQAYDFIGLNMANADNLPELILLDINMPLMNGWQFLESFRHLENRGYKPVIYLVSSSVDPSDLLKYQFYTELTGYLTKPLSQQQLGELIDTASQHANSSLDPGTDLTS